MSNFQVLLDAASFLSKQESAGSNRNPGGDFSLESTISAHSGVSLSSSVGGRSFAQVSRLSRNGIFLAASCEREHLNISSDVDFPPLTGTKSKTKIRPDPRKPRKPLLELNGPRHHPQRSETTQTGSKKMMSMNPTATEREQVESMVRRASTSAVNLNNNRELSTQFDSSFPPLAGTKSTVKIRSEPRNPRTPLIDLNGPRRSAQRTLSAQGDPRSTKGNPITMASTNLRETPAGLLERVESSNVSALVNLQATPTGHLKRIGSSNGHVLEASAPTPSSSPVSARDDPRSKKGSPSTMASTNLRETPAGLLKRVESSNVSALVNLQATPTGHLKRIGSSNGHVLEASAPTPSSSPVSARDDPRSKKGSPSTMASTNLRETPAGLLKRVESSNVSALVNLQATPTGHLKRVGSSIGHVLEASAPPPSSSPVSARGGPCSKKGSSSSMALTNLRATPAGLKRIESSDGHVLNVSAQANLQATPTGLLKRVGSSDGHVLEASAPPPSSSPVSARDGFAEPKQQNHGEGFGNVSLLDITFGDFSAPITSTPKALISRTEIIENISTRSANDTGDNSVHSHNAYRWSFAGWARPIPRTDVRSVSVCTNAASAFPGVLDLSVQKRSAEVPDRSTSEDPCSRQGSPRSMALTNLPETPAGFFKRVESSDGHVQATPAGHLKRVETTNGHVLDASAPPPSSSQVIDNSRRDQNSDESEANSETDYSAGSDEEWEPSDLEEDQHKNSLDTSFLNNYSIREYFEPYKNFIPDEEETGTRTTREIPRNGPKKNSRKAVRKARERGTGYVRDNGTVVPSRRVKDPCRCPKSCGEKFTEQARQEMLRNLLQMKSTSQHQFLSCHVAVMRPRRTQVLNSRRTITRRYFLPGVDGRIQVCKKMFKSTFDVGDATIRTIAKQLSAGLGMAPDDGRLQNRSNKTVDPEHIEFIRNHINSFPATESHYNVAKSEKTYLSSDLNLAIMYRLYLKECEGKYEPVCYDTYRLIFKPMKISFKQPKVDTCGECDRLVLQSQLSEGTEKEKIIEQHKNHRQRGDSIFDEKKADMNLARTEVSICCACFDLQKQLPTPSLTCGKAFYARQLYTYNLTVYQTIEGNNSSDCYLWNETQAKRGSQEIGSCVMLHLESLPITISKVIYYSDRCGGQNRNKNIVFMFMLFIERCKATNRNFEIEHKFMQTGHSHMEVDAVHGAIERARKRKSTNIETPHDWATFISCIYRSTPMRVHELEQCNILNYKSLINRYKIPKKNLLGDPLRFGDVMVFRYSTNCPGLIHYKYHVTDQFERCFKIVSADEIARGVNNIVLNPVYSEPLPIPDVKLKDLQNLMPYIKQKDFYATFLKKLVPVKRGRRAACKIPDNFDADLSESEDELEEED